MAAAKLACLQCRRRVDCLGESAADDEYGVRGGLTPAERAGWTVGDGDPLDLRNFPDAPKWYPKPFNWQGAGPRCDRRNLFAAVAAASAGIELRVVAEKFAVSLTSLQRATHIRRWAPELVDDVCDGHVQFREAAEYALQVRDFFTPGRPAVAMSEAA